MPKYRKFFVKATESLDINDMPDDFHRLLWVMLPLGLDAAGRGLDNTSWIKSKVMPLREDVTANMIEAAFSWYEDRQMIYRYEVDGRKYFCIPTWHKYQGDTSREADSNFPEPNSRVSHELVKSNSNDNEYVYESVNDNEHEQVSSLQTAFINASGIPDYGTDAAEICAMLVEKGVSEDDVTKAVKILQNKKYTIKGLSSIVTTAINLTKQKDAVYEREASEVY